MLRGRIGREEREPWERLWVVGVGGREGDGVSEIEVVMVMGVAVAVAVALG